MIPIKPRVLVLTGYGINCEEEIGYGFQAAGGKVDIVHINDLIDGLKKLADYQILAIPGGFSFGDDTGAGNAYANRLKNHLQDDLYDFIQNDKLVLGLCNGCQILANMGFIPALDGSYRTIEAAFRYNIRARYEDRWVTLKNRSKKCVFTKNIDILRVPIGHGEGNFYATESTVLALKENDQIVFQFVKPDGSAANQEFPHNPNGSILDIAAICDPSGRVMGMMPHPDRHLYFINGDLWTILKEKYLRDSKEMPEEGEGMQIFRNAIEYFV